LDPNIALTGGSKGKWTAAEDSKLKDAVQTHGDMDWGVISAVVPGRAIVSVTVDGRKSWDRTSAARVDARVNG
jgi:flavin-binding protein dodecin